MNPIAKNILAVVAGLVVGGIVNMGLIKLAPLVVPLPEGADVSTMEGLRESMKSFKPANFIFPFLAHALGTRPLLGEGAEDRQPDCSRRQALDEGERVWNDISSHLDHSEILCEDIQVLHLKVGLFKEAENLSRLSRRVHCIEKSSRSCFCPEKYESEAELEWNPDGLLLAMLSSRSIGPDMFF